MSSSGPVRYGRPAGRDDRAVVGSGYGAYGNELCAPRKCSEPSVSEDVI